VPSMTAPSAGRSPPPRPHEAIVLAGGAGRRLGGFDKAALEVGGRPLLDRVLDALSGAAAITVVGPTREAFPGVRWALELPPGGGPVAALAAGLEGVTGPVAVVVAVDLPFLDRDLIGRLVATAAADEGDGAAVSGPDGCIQPLAAAYRTDSLRAALAAVGDPAGASVRALVAHLKVGAVRHPTAGLDCDTWADVDRARAMLSTPGVVR
jgi:molybdopterin-guanine dinucleotide biosynthesis protein A